MFVLCQPKRFLIALKVVVVVVVVVVLSSLIHESDCLAD